VALLPGEALERGGLNRPKPQPGKTPIKHGSSPDRPESVPTGDGLRVGMRRIAGLTASGILEIPFVFQVPPLEEFTESGSHAHTEYDTIGQGQFSRATGRQLREYSFQTLALDSTPGWSQIQEYNPHPILVKRELMAIMDSGTPFQLFAHQMELWGVYDINVPATLRSVSSTEKAGEIDARYFSLGFKEFRSAAIRTRVRGKGRPRGSSQHGPKSVLVRSLPGAQATLHKLAKRHYGSPAQWRVLTTVASNGLAEVGPSDDLRRVFKASPTKRLIVPANPNRLPEITDEDDYEFYVVD
jgi:hypothetical protein